MDEIEEEEFYEILFEVVRDAFQEKNKSPMDLFIFFLGSAFSVSYATNLPPQIIYEMVEECMLNKTTKSLTRIEIDKYFNSLKAKEKM